MKEKNMDLNGELISYIKKKFNVSDINPETGLITAGIIDSFGILELINHIEEKYKISIKAEDMDIVNFKSVSAIADLIQRNKI